MHAAPVTVCVDVLSLSLFPSLPRLCVLLPKSQVDGERGELGRSVGKCTGKKTRVYVHMYGNAKNHLLTHSALGRPAPRPIKFSRHVHCVTKSRPPNNFDAEKTKDL